MTDPGILITGATGRTGRNTVEILVKQGAAVRALVHNDEDRAARLRALGASVEPGRLSCGPDKSALTIHLSEHHS